MSVNCDGVINTSENQVARIQNASLEGVTVVPDPNEENIKTKVFRGFDKVPKVVLPRYDITPYLKNGCLLPIRRNIGKKTLSNTIFLENFVQQCSVKLVRDDLELLKHSFLIKSPRSDISGTECNEAMISMSCKICHKIYASEKKLLNHQKNKHVIFYKPESKTQKRVSFSDHIIVHEVKEYHKCRKCTRIFEDYKSLKEHMKQKHKKRKCYICHYCNKNFVDRMFFKVHIKLHCDVCSTLLPNRSSYLDHRRNVCRVLKMHTCKTCYSSFFRFMDLKDHSYEHLSTFFICDICKDQFETKCGVSHHISFLHSKMRPTTLYMMRNLGNERLYLCNFCDESSVERDIIEAHAQSLPDLTNRAMTGYKDYYFCDQCLWKFDTEQDMLQHKWTHFLNTSDNSQIRPKGILSKQKKVKTTFRVDEKIPDYLKPQVVVEKLIIKEDNVGTSEEDSVSTGVPPVKRTLKKTMLSNYQCSNCNKYFSTNYCLTRHIETQHSDYDNLRCKVCEETFVWPSLLKSHKCIRLKIPEMPFDDARPEIHFDNLHEITQNGFDDFNITDNDDYMNSIDFDIPAPVVQLTEGANALNHCVNNVNYVNPLHSLGYKVIMQEVPIEF